MGFDFTEEQWEEFEHMAGAGFSIKKIAMYFKVNTAMLQDAYEQDESEVRFHYDRGQLMKEAKRDIELSKSADGGSITSIQILDKRVKERRIEDIKERILNGF